MTVGFLQILLLPCQKQGQLVHVAVCQRVVLQESCSREISSSPRDAQPPQHCGSRERAVRNGSARELVATVPHRVDHATPHCAVRISRVRQLLGCDYVHLHGFFGI